MIKINKRLLALALVAAVLIVGAATIVSLTGNDKPNVTTNPKDTVEQPNDSPVTPVTTVADVPASSDDSQTAPADSDEPTNDTEPDDDENGDDNGNGNGNNNGTGDAKAHGLERAIEVHERNIAKHANSPAKANGHANAHADPNHGLQNSLAKLNENLDKMIEGQNQDNLESQSHGNANGHK